MAVVHVTHRAVEVANADRVVSLTDSRAGERDDHAPAPIPIGAPIIELRGVGYAYSRRTPWEHRALTESVEAVERAADGRVGPPPDLKTETFTAPGGNVVVRRRAEPSGAPSPRAEGRNER